MGHTCEICQEAYKGLSQGGGMRTMRILYSLYIRHHI